VITFLKEYFAKINVYPLVEFWSTFSFLAERLFKTPSDKSSQQSVQSQEKPVSSIEESKKDTLVEFVLIDDDDVSEIRPELLTEKISDQASTNSVDKQSCEKVTEAEPIDELEPSQLNVQVTTVEASNKTHDSMNDKRIEIESIENVTLTETNADLNRENSLDEGKTEVERATTEPMLYDGIFDEENMSISSVSTYKEDQCQLVQEQTNPSPLLNDVSLFYFYIQLSETFIEIIVSYLSTFFCLIMTCYG
jgi:hypothetical protein